MAQEDRRYINKPIGVIQNKILTPIEQDYLCLIASLEKKEGCTASNKWFAGYFDVKRQTAQEHIGNLKKKGFIDTSEKKKGGKTEKRTIWIIDSYSREVLLMDSRKSQSGLAGNSEKDSRKTPTHKINENKYKTNSGPPLPAEGQAGRLIENPEQVIAENLKKIGKKPRGKLKPEEQCQQDKKAQIKALLEDEKTKST